MQKKQAYILVSMVVAMFSFLMPLFAMHQSPVYEKEIIMTAKGEFDIQMKPQTDKDFEMGRMTLEKTFRGDLSGSSKGQMLSVRTAVDGSAGYVAIEVFTGTLVGKAGAFHLQHSGTMSQGAAAATITVIPDSGTDELAGLSGEMAIDIVDGQHVYDFTYKLSPAENEN